MILLIAAAFFVLGVLLETVARWRIAAPPGGAPAYWADRVAWLFFSIAAILAFVSLLAGHSGP